MAEAVDLTAAAELGIKVSVENAIQNVLGNSDPNSTMAAAQDIVNLENTISRKFKALTESITDVVNGISNLRSSQDETARQSADTALAAEEQNSPLGRMADSLDNILLFLQEKFKPTGLGSEDANVGMLSKKEESSQIEEKKPEEKKADSKNDGSAWVAGTLVAATMMAIKDKLNETWVGVTQTFLKPVAAIKLAFKPWSKTLRNANINVQRFTSKIINFTKKLAPRITKIFTSVADAGRKVAQVIRNMGGSITKAVKNFNLGKFFKPVTEIIKKLTGGPGFGLKGLFKFMNPVLGVFKKLALPITLVLEAFEAFKMIFVGSFTKNAEALSESISEKGILGRAWYGFTHMFQTLATFGYELVETFKAVADAAFTFLDPVVEAFHRLTDTISNMFLDMYNAIARNSMGLIDEIPTEGAKKMDRREALKRSLNLKNDEARADRITDTLIERGSKVGVELEDGDDLKSFKDRIQATERAKKAQEQAAPQELIPVPTKNQDGFNPRGVEQNIQQNSIQNNTRIEVQMPTAASMLNQ